MAISVATLIDRAKALADRRNDASVPDTDWLAYVNDGVEDLYRLLVSFDAALYFASVDFTLTGSAAAAAFNLVPVGPTVRLATAAALPANTPGGGPGPGRTLVANANGALTVDGTATALNDLILVKDEVNQANNGVWQQIVVGSGGAPYILLRVFNFDQALPSEIQVGATIAVTAGATNIGKTFYLSSFAGIVDTSAQVYLQGTGLGFRGLHGLDLYPDTTNRRTIARRNFRERNMGRIGWWDPTILAGDRQYDLRQNSLVITPYEIATGPYRLYYRQAPYKFSSVSDATALDVQMEPYDEWIRIMAARTGMGIEGGDQGVGSSRLAELKDSIASACRRDDEPAVLADVEGDYATGWWP